ncbi:MAG: hypothetical protein ABF296_05215, partial [Oceanococcaceae bacterium]
MNNSIFGMRLQPLAWGLLLGAAPAFAIQAPPAFAPQPLSFIDNILAAERVAPATHQRRAALDNGWRVRFNHHGTPKMLFNDSGRLSGPQSGAPEAIARSFLKAQAALMGITTAQVDGMETLRVSPLHESPQYLEMLQGREVSRTDVPHVVLLRQTFSGLPAAGREGLVTVGITRDGAVAFVGSTLARDSELSAT